MSVLHAVRLSRNTLPAFAAEGVFWGAYAAFAPQLKEGIGATDAQFGVVLLMAAIGAVSAMWLAPLFDARAGRFAMALAAVLLALSFQGPMWVAGLWAFAGLMIFAGACSGVLDVVMNARLSMLESRHRTSLMNLNHAVFSFAYAASALGAGMARAAGVAPAVVFFALLVLIALLAVTMMQPEAEHTPQSHTRAQVRLPGAVLWGGAIIFAAFMAENAVEGWSALHIERTLGGGAAQGALGPAVLGLTMGFGRFAGQLVVSRVGTGAVLLWAALLSAAGAFTAAAAPAPMVAYIGFGVLGLGVSVIAPMAFALIGQRVSDDVRSRAISRAAIIGYFGFFIGPPLIGFVSEVTSLRISFYLIGVVLLSIPVFLAVLRRSQ